MSTYVYYIGVYIYILVQNIYNRSLNSHTVNVYCENKNKLYKLIFNIRLF